MREYRLSPDMTRTRGTMRKGRAHTWAFAARFHRRAFGWRSAPAVQRVEQAVAEIKTVARRVPVLAAAARPLG